MSGYGSPSLVKMEASSRRGGRRQKRHFSLGRILGDPFALATISIAIVRRFVPINPDEEVLFANQSVARVAYCLRLWYHQQSQRLSKTPLP